MWEQVRRGPQFTPRTLLSNVLGKFLRSRAKLMCISWQQASWYKIAFGTPPSSGNQEELKRLNFFFSLNSLEEEFMYLGTCFLCILGPL